ncbi:MAG: hypothetical protein H6721_31465 [Sandaracinus sp.]|nr:hypothetical protein [Sandaracinus sp.]
MSDPRPLKDDPETPDVLRRWLVSARPIEPLDEARRRRVRRRVAAGVTGVAAVAIAWKAFAALVVTATIGSVVWLATRDTPPVSPPRSVPVVAPVEAAPEPPVEEAAVEEPVEPVEAAPPAESIDPPRRRSTTPREAERSLGDETELLRRAAAAVQTRPRAAWEAVREHERRYADGALVGERELIAVDVLRRLGRPSAALRRARAAASRHRGTLVGRRAEELVRELETR